MFHPSLPFALSARAGVNGAECDRRETIAKFAGLSIGATRQGSTDVNPASRDDFARCAARVSGLQDSADATGPATNETFVTEETTHVATPASAFARHQDAGVGRVGRSGGGVAANTSGGQEFVTSQIRAETTCPAHDGDAAGGGAEVVASPFQSGTPEAEGRKDGYAGSPPNRGHYGDDAWLAYLIGYRAGCWDKAQWHAEQARAILAAHSARYEARRAGR